MQHSTSIVLGAPSFVGFIDKGWGIERSSTVFFNTHANSHQTWLLDGRLPHVGIVVSTGLLGPRVVHNIGAGVQENALFSFRSQHAKAHFRWPAA